MHVQESKGPVLFQRVWKWHPLRCSCLAGWNVVTSVPSLGELGALSYPAQGLVTEE